MIIDCTFVYDVCACICVCVCMCACVGLCMPCTRAEDREQLLGTSSLLLPCGGGVCLLVAAMLCVQASWSVNFRAIPSLPPILLFGMLEFHILMTTLSVLVFSFFVCFLHGFELRLKSSGLGGEPSLLTELSCWPIFLW